MRHLSDLPAKVLALVEKVRSSFWIVPLIMAVVALGLSELSLWLDRVYFQRGAFPLSLWSGDQSVASAVLTTLAGSMITLIGVVFSLTMVALSLASNQFGPRLLRQYMRDRSTQVTLGTFLGTFLFCVSVLRHLEMGTRAPVPYLSVFLALASAGLSMVALVRFLQRLASSIEAPTLVAEVAREFLERIEAEFDPLSEGTLQEPEVELPAGEPACRLSSDKARYLVGLDAPDLVELACRRDALLVVHLRPGHFAAPPDAVVSVYCDRPWGEEELEELRDHFVWSTRRSPVQDVEYHLRQLVEVGVRALSPGINDPHTAVNCVDWVSAGLATLAGRKMPDAVLRDDQGRVRLIMERPLRFEGLVDMGFDELRQYGGSHMAVRIHLLRGLGRVARATPEDRQAAVLSQAQSLVDLERPADFKDLQDLTRACREAGFADLWD